MSLYIQQEARLAGISFVLGLVLMGSYDLLRLFRFFVPHSDLWRGLEDLGFWIYCAIMTFSLLFYANSGILRGYVIISTFFGMFLYDRFVSRKLFDRLYSLKKWKIWIKMKIRHGKNPESGNRR